METKVSALTILAVLDPERDALIRDLREKTGTPVAGFPLHADTLKQYLPDAQLLIHCTPVGMSPNIDESCVPRDLMIPPLVVMDVVYNPLETRLLAEARKQGCRTVRGLEMFLQQAVGQFELWTETPAPVHVMRTVLEGQFSREGASPAGKESGRGTHCV
jgi:shikimate dehydrogenase